MRIKKLNKKGQAFEMIIKATIVIVIAIIVIFIFRNLMGQQQKVGEGQIAGLTGDCDSDGQKDIIDPCPCDAKKPDVNGVCKTKVDACNTMIKDGKCPK